MSKIIKFKIKKGYVVYKMTALDCIFLFNGVGLCDSCNTLSPIGYYVPILNYYMCEKCFKEWAERCTYYLEDLWFEKLHIDYIESFVKQDILKMEIEDEGEY